jgi:uncharacterized protein (TIGR00299 family) protein
MPTLLIDMPGGVAGDMLLAALFDLGGDLGTMQSDLAVLHLGKIGITIERVAVSGITALRVDVEAEKQAHWIGASPTLKQIPPHRHYREIRDLLDKAPLAARVKARAQKVFRTLAEAEGAVHGVPPEDVHFHEVGAVDAIVDVVGCCLLMEQLRIDRVISAPLTPGEGHVECAHGRMPVPVPAVAAMLASFQAPQRRTGRETGELTTPTGCALVVALTDRFLQPHDHVNLAVTKIGHGAGHKTIPGLFNAVRCSLALETADAATEEIAELRCQVDDATGEQLAVLVQDLIDAGAHDAYLTPVIMKKGRPGHEITVICPAASQALLRDLLLNSSPTIGVRYQTLLRQVLKRRVDNVTLRGQAIAMKVVITPDGSERAKPEAEAVAAAAKKLKLPFQAVQHEAMQAWAAKSPKS